jgi:hypothetical protein
MTHSKNYLRFLNTFEHDLPSAVKHWPLLAPLFVVIEVLVQASFWNVTTLNKLKAGEKKNELMSSKNQIWFLQDLSYFWEQEVLLFFLSLPYPFPSLYNMVRREQHWELLGATSIRSKPSLKIRTANAIFWIYLGSTA